MKSLDYEQEELRVFMCEMDIWDTDTHLPVQAVVAGTLTKKGRQEGWHFGLFFI